MKVGADKGSQLVLDCYRSISRMRGTPGRALDVPALSACHVEGDTRASRSLNGCEGVGGRAVIVGSKSDYARRCGDITYNR